MEYNNTHAMIKIKTCIKCELPKNLSDFTILTSKFSKSKYSNICKDCKKQTDAAYYQRNKIKIISKTQEYYANNLLKVSEKGKLRYHKQVKNDYLSIMLSGCRSNARKRNREFSINKQLILNLLDKQNNKCYYSGDEMTLERGLYNTVSVDRVDSNKGYIESNIVLCCQKINVVKNNLNDVDFINLCIKIAKYKGGV